MGSGIISGRRRKVSESMNVKASFCVDTKDLGGDGDGLVGLRKVDKTGIGNFTIIALTSRSPLKYTNRFL